MSREKNGKVILHKGYGWANVARGIRITIETVFDVVSLTRQFTAIAMQDEDWQVHLSFEGATCLAIKQKISLASLGHILYRYGNGVKIVNDARCNYEPRDDARIDQSRP